MIRERGGGKKSRKLHDVLYECHPGSTATSTTTTSTTTVGTTTKSATALLSQPWFYYYLNPNQHY